MCFRRPSEANRGNETPSKKLADQQSSETQTTSPSAPSGSGDILAKQVMQADITSIKQRLKVWPAVKSQVEAIDAVNMVARFLAALRPVQVIPTIEQVTLNRNKKACDSKVSESIGVRVVSTKDVFDYLLDPDAVYHDKYTKARKKAQKKAIDKRETENAYLRSGLPVRGDKREDHVSDGVLMGGPIKPDPFPAPTFLANEEHATRLMPKAVEICQTPSFQPEEGDGIAASGPTKEISPNISEDSKLDPCHSSQYMHCPC